MGIAFQAEGWDDPASVFMRLFYAVLYSFQFICETLRDTKPRAEEGDR